MDFKNNPPNEYISIDLDNPVKIIYDTGNSTTTIIGMGFIRYILSRLQNTEIYNENTIKNQLKKDFEAIALKLNSNIPYMFQTFKENIEKSFLEIKNLML